MTDSAEADPLEPGAIGLESEQAEGNADASTAESPEPATAAEPGVVDLPEQTAAEPSVLEAELEDLKDRHLRLAAEYDNFRKRTRKERADLSVHAQADLARRILPALDDLARVAATPSDTITVEALEKGLELILRNLEKELEAAGLKRIDSIDARFDPEIHEALMVTTVDDADLDETVSRVFVDGYSFGDRLVRPAQVEVRRYDSSLAADTRSPVGTESVGEGIDADGRESREDPEAE